MSNNKSVKSFKVVIIVLAFSVVGSLYYIFKSSDRNRNAIISLREEKSLVLKDLEKSELFLKQIVTSNKDLQAQLIIEKEKVSKLILEIRTGTLDNKSLGKVKLNASGIDAKIKLLLNQIDSYKNRIDSTNVVLKNEKNKNDTLSSDNKKLISKVNDASALYFHGLQTSFFRVKSSGKQQETNNASNIDVIKFSFMVAENKFAKTFHKEFFIQIIDPKNNILGSKEERRFGNDILTFSHIIFLNYDNKTLIGQSEIKTKDLDEGVYTINLFDKSKLLLTNTFTLQ